MWLQCVSTCVCTYICMYSMYSHPVALNELFTSHLLTTEECSEVALMGRLWVDHLNQVLLAKPAEVMQEETWLLCEGGAEE